MPPIAGSVKPETTPSHTRMTGEDRRQQLIDVAIDLFSKRGFAGTTTKEIAAAAGVTEAIIFRHFTTKQDFYKAILDSKCGSDEARDWMAETRAFMDQNDDEGLFRFLISTILRIFRERPEFERLLIHAALEGHELAIMHHNHVGSSIGVQFKEYIARRQREGALRECDPGIVLLALAGVPQFYALQKYIYQREIPIPDDEMAEGFLRILMGGLVRDGREAGVNEGKAK